MDKPVIRYNSVGETGNIFSILYHVNKALTKIGRKEDYKTIYERVQKCTSYKQALQVINEYVTLIDDENEQWDKFNSICLIFHSTYSGLVDRFTA